MTVLYNEDFPSGLKDIDDSPSKLFVYGIVELMFKKNMIGIVGSRYPSDEGKKSAYEFSKSLAKNGFEVISGMAIGVDTYAHKGALDANGSTIAVLGCGIEINYPRSNLKLKENIRSNHLIVTEYESNVTPKGYHYPYRNRIISGLSKGILVIESRIKSGTLTTVNHALNQGKPVFVIPGSIYNPLSEGNNYLLKCGAIPVTSVNDILDYYQIFNNK
ncbi:MAG: DNA-processing protein DprA [Clostridiales bacterium]|nr:DNA-processing protein DprA [Clostridiales bacterium]